MNIDDFSFHDSKILEVKENTSKKTLDFLLDFPIDWENDVFENRILRFIDVVFYLIDEIPIAGQPTILRVDNLGQIKKDLGTEYHPWEIKRNKVEFHTTAGKRIIEFSEFELIKPN